MNMKIEKKCIMLALMVSALFIWGTAAFASEGGGHGAASTGKAMTKKEAIKAAVEGNSQFTSHHDLNYFEPYQSGQSPNLTVISCADSRVHTPLFGMDPHNNIFIIRNVGNQIRNSEGSVDYGVRHLPTKILLVMGHAGCGAVKAAMGDYSSETTGIKAELDTLIPVLAFDKGEGSFTERWNKNVERNVDYQVAYALQIYGDKIDHDEMAVVGAVYDFKDNYGKGRGTLVITNINGQSDPNKIMNDPLLKELSKSEIVKHVGSIAPAL